MLSRRNQVGTMLPAMRSLVRLGFEVSSVIVIGRTSGGKKHLAFSPDSSDPRLEEIGDVFFAGAEKTATFLEAKSIYLSFEAPQRYLRDLGLPRMPWIQIQNGGGDLFIHASRSDIEPDLTLVWGEGWLSSEFLNHPQLYPKFREAAQRMNTRPSLVLGNLNFESAPGSPELKRSRHLHFFEPNILEKSGIAALDKLSLAKASITKRQELLETRSAIESLASESIARGYSLGYRSRKKSLALNLGQDSFRESEDDSDSPNHASFEKSSAILTFLPSISALEALRKGVKVIQGDTRRFIPPQTDNAVTPNYAMYEILKTQLPESLISLEASEAGEALDLLELSPKQADWEALHAWSAMNVDRDQVLFDAIESAVTATT